MLYILYNNNILNLCAFSAEFQVLYLNATRHFLKQ